LGEKASKELLLTVGVVIVIVGLLLVVMLIRPQARKAAVLYALPLHLPHHA